MNDPITLFFLLVSALATARFLLSAYLARVVSGRARLRGQAGTARFMNAFGLFRLTITAEKLFWIVVVALPLVTGRTTLDPNSRSYLLLIWALMTGAQALAEWHLWRRITEAEGTP